MSSYYYSREAGAEGQILTGEGTAPGVGLDTLLDRERPPLRAALAIGSALADLLCISLEDRMVHGDIRPAHVKIDTNGTVSLEGYGVQRRTTKAPEGKPDSHATDVYGLGVVLHSILSAEPLGNLPKEADAHDDEVVSRVLAMDFRQVQGKRWLEDVRKFLCQILAWTPADRPAPLDAANVLASVAAQCPGETLEAWAKRVNAAPSRAPAAAAPTPVRPAVVEEDLGGPVALSGPLAKGGARQAPAAKGESTAFWSREKIAAMLAEDDDEPPIRQSVNVPKAAQRAEPRAEPTFRMEEPARIDPPRRPDPEPRRPEPEPPRPRPEPQRPEPQRPEPQRAQPEPQRSQAASPFANAKIEAADPFEQPEKKTSPLVWVAVVLVLLGLVCGGLTLGGGGLYWVIGTGTSTTAAQEAAEKAAKEAEAKAKEAEAKAKEAAEKATQEAGGDAAGSEPKTESKSETKVESKSETKTESKSETKATTPATTTTKTTATTTTKTTTPKTTTPKTTTTKTTTPKTTTTTTAAPATASFSVKFSAPGREGKLQCGDGQTAEFAGATTMTFDTTTTCLVRIDMGKGAVQVSRTASVTCSEDSGKVTCSGN